MGWIAIVGVDLAVIAWFVRIRERAIAGGAPISVIDSYQGLFLCWIGIPLILANLLMIWLWMRFR
jgi:hypothetical protein